MIGKVTLGPGEDLFRAEEKTKYTGGERKIKRRNLGEPERGGRGFLSSGRKICQRGKK